MFWIYMIRLCLWWGSSWINFRSSEHFMKNVFGDLNWRDILSDKYIYALFDLLLLNASLFFLLSWKQDNVQQMGAYGVKMPLMMMKWKLSFFWVVHVENEWRPELKRLLVKWMVRFWESNSILLMLA